MHIADDGNYRSHSLYLEPSVPEGGVFHLYPSRGHPSGYERRKYGTTSSRLGRKGAKLHLMFLRHIETHSDTAGI
jgi:hypothetical protein